MAIVFILIIPAMAGTRALSIIFRVNFVGYTNEEKKIDVHRPKNIRRAFYKTYTVHAVHPKGEKGGETDRMVSAAMENIRQSGEWVELMTPVYHEYVDWLP